VRFARGRRRLRTQLAHDSDARQGQPVIAEYDLEDDSGQFKAAALDVLTLEGSRIKEITGFVMPEIFPRFGLPPELAS
jgi:RNA polymerase sigma-70 factor (ECF subfamily)